MNTRKPRSDFFDSVPRKADQEFRRFHWYEQWSERLRLRDQCSNPTLSAAASARRNLDMANFLAYIKAMKVANIGEFKNSLSSYLAAVELGEEIEIRKRNIPIARVIPVRGRGKNQTVLGCGAGSVEISGSLTEALIPESDWEMLKGDTHADSP